ncbi:hypothetical protein ACVWYP_003881 [Bradyrhizobium sp. USDA 3262]
MLDDVEAERTGLHRVLPARLQHEANRRLRQAIEDGCAHGHEAERDPVIGAGIDGDDVRDSEPDLAAGEIGEHDNEVLQHQNRHQRGQAEIRSPHPQRRQRQHEARDDRRQRAEQDADVDRPAELVVEDPGGVGAGADQEGRPKIDLAGEAEQEVPGHREHAEIERDGKQPEDVARDVERQRRGDHHADQRNEEQARGKEAGHLSASRAGLEAGYTSRTPEAAAPEWCDRPARSCRP